MLTPQVKEAFDEIQNNRLIREIPPENSMCLQRHTPFPPLGIPARLA